MYAERLRYAATATGCYSGPALKLLGAMLDRLDADLARQSALRTCQRHLNPDGSQSDWQTARHIAADLPRIHRWRINKVLSDYEEALTVISQGAQSAVKIHGELTHLR